MHGLSVGSGLIDGVWKDGNFQVHQRRGVDQLATVEGLPLFTQGLSGSQSQECGA
jgi:hypothetical protein